MANDWLTIKEASNHSGYTPIHLQELARFGRIKARKVVTVWLVSRKSLDAYLKEQSERGEKRGRKPLT